MKRIGIVICNYNKCDYVINCIRSVLESVYQDFDVYVVDNASTDSSVTRIQEEYGERVHLIVNERNLGGSGGFNTGIRAIVEMGYEYLMLLDNDVLVDENAIEALYRFLLEHPAVGMVGSKIYHMNSPEYIQQFGLEIDFERASARTLYADVPDTEDIPEVVSCDTVATCSVMLPVKVVKEAGMLPQDNFIYWDDMELGYRIKQLGYQVAAYGRSLVLHEMGAFYHAQSSSCMYYQWRNRINFFLHYTPQNKLEKMSLQLLRSFFYEVYINMYRRNHEIVKVLMFAYQDAMANIRGKAEGQKIIPYDEKVSAFIALAQNADTYWMEEEDSRIEAYLLKRNPSIIKKNAPEQASLKLKKCSNIMNLTDFSLEYCYIDENLDIAADLEDIMEIKNYPYSLQLFLYMNQPQFLYHARKISIKTNTSNLVSCVR